MILNIKNIGPISRAAILIGDKVTLIAGGNEAGKTTCLRAITACLRGEVMPGKMPNKDAGMLVHAGEADGCASLSGNGWASLVSYPDAKVSGKGLPPEMSGIAAGSESYLAMSAADRAKLLADVLGIIPKPSMARDRLGEFLDSEAVDRWVSRLFDDHGVAMLDRWDAEAKRAAEAATMAKGAWAKVTGQAWGSEKARSWKPEGWQDSYAETSRDNILEMIRIGREKVVAASGESAVDAARRADLAAKAAGAAVAEVALTEAQEALARCEAAKARAIAERNKLPVANEEASHSCPHCSAPISARHDHVTGEISLSKPVDMDKADAKLARLAIAAADGEISRHSDAAKFAEREIMKARAALDAAEKAAADLAAMGDPVAGTGNVEAAQKIMATSEAILAKLDQMADSSEECRKFLSASKMVEFLGPNGFRRSVLTEALDKFNRDHLEPICEAAGFKRAAISADLSPTYGGMPVPLLSESAKWRLSLAIQVAIAKLDGSAIILVDAMDILSPQCRQGAAKMLAGIGMPAVVTMTASGQDRVPPLAKAGIGSVFWMQDGGAVEVGSA